MQILPGWNNAEHSGICLPRTFFSTTLWIRLKKEAAAIFSLQALSASWRCDCAKSIFAETLP